MPIAARGCRIHLERERRIRNLPLTELGRIPIGECPERIATGCNPDYESKFIVAQWMAWRDTEGGLKSDSS